jgi:hypothetical protein
MMSQLEIKVQVPDFLVDTVDVDKNKFEEYIRQTLAVELYRVFKTSINFIIYYKISLKGIDFFFRK